MPVANPKNSTSAASSDLGLMPNQDDLDDEETKRKKLLQQQQELMGRSGTSVYGQASMSLLGSAGFPGG